MMVSDTFSGLVGGFAIYSTICYFSPPPGLGIHELYDQTLPSERDDRSDKDHINEKGRATSIEEKDAVI
jgi:hypothetical protein